MFETLSGKLSGSLRKVRGRGRLTEENVSKTLNEVKMALLEADVNFRVVKVFLRSVKSRAVGEEVQGSLTPGQQFIKIVIEELTEMMGGANSGLTEPETAPLVTMLVGLQGSGKTSSAGKLARLYKTEGKRPYLIPADIYRPAAIQQLQVLAGTLGISCYPSRTDQNPLDIVQNGLEAAKQEEADAVFIDTAGRLHIDQELMEELSRIKDSVMPHEILFVADAMTGQEAVSVAKGFNDLLDITGVMLTKMDGDARGGAAVSITEVTGKPIKFMSTSEKIDALDVFEPERIADQILGFGDAISLVKKAEAVMDLDSAKAIEKKILDKRFDLEDFLAQIKQLRKMGPLDQLIGMLPSENRNMIKKLNFDNRQLVWTEAIIKSMTQKEREIPHIINGNRRQRIANGSGRSVQEVNHLLKQFSLMQRIIKKKGQLNIPSLKGGMKKLSVLS